MLTTFLTAWLMLTPPSPPAGATPAEGPSVVRLQEGAATAVAGIREALEEGRTAAALELAAQAADRFPESPQALLWAGHAHRLAGQLVAAGRIYRRTLELDERQPEAHMGLGSVLEGAGNASAARESYRRALELAPEAPAPRRPLAKLAMRAGDHALAAEHFGAWLDSYPDDLEARYLHGLAHYLAGAPDEAISIFEPLLAADPAYIPAVYALGVVLADRPESHSRARDLLSRALDNDWESANAAYLIGRIDAEAGRDEEAARMLREALERDPDLIDAHYQLALVLNRLGLRDEARERMERFRALQQAFNEREAADKELKSLRNELATQLASGRVEEALATVDRLLAEFPDSPEALLQASKVWISTGRPRQAMDAALAARQTAPDNWEAWYLEGLLLLRADDPAAALQRLRAALERNPLFPDAHALAGNALLALGDATGAARAYLAAIDLETDNPAYWLNLATAYEAMGRDDLQADALQTYRSLTTRDEPPS